MIAALQFFFADLEVRPALRASRGLDHRDGQAPRDGRFFCKLADWWWITHGEHRKVWGSEYPRAYCNLHCEDN